MPLLARRTARPLARPAAAPLDFDERLTLAGLSTPDTTLDLADVVTALPTGAPPVAALFHRAQARILRDGWSRDAATDGCGGACLINTIIAESRSHAEESEARALLRQVVGGGDPIPQLNRRLRSGAEAAQILGRAAALAEQRGV